MRGIKAADRTPDDPTGHTLGQFCAAKLAAVCEHTSFRARTDEILASYRDLSASWSARPIGSRPPWSGLTCDLTPFEISIALRPSGDDELRFLLEPQGEPPCPATYWAQSRALFDVLESRWGADLARLRRIEDLIEPEIGGCPTDEEGASCTGYGAVFNRRQRAFKFWFSPDCKGVGRTAAVCEEVMRRLGLAAAWRRTSQRLPRTASLLFGLELGGGPAARVKVYVRVRDPDLAELERVAGLAAGYLPGELPEFWASLRWNHFPVMRPHLIALHFVAGAARPVGYALQFATFPFLPNDALVQRCLRASLRHYGISTSCYDGALRGLAGKCDLERERLIHSWVTFQRDPRGQPRLAVYFPGRAYLPTFGALGARPRVRWPYPDPDLDGPVTDD